jgi:hypothetical protein
MLPLGLFRAFLRVQQIDYGFFSALAVLYMKKLAPGVGPSGRMHHLGVTHMVVCRITIGLEYALEVAQEPLGTLSFSAHSKVEHRCCLGPAVSPHVSLMISTSCPSGLNPTGVSPAWV